MNEYELIRLGSEIGEIDGIVFNVLKKLKRSVLKHNRLCEDYCNIPNFNYERIEKQEKKIEHLIKELPVKLNIKIESIQHDPRGWEYKFNSYWLTQWIYIK